MAQIDKIYADLILKGKKTLDNVPEKNKVEVEKIIKQKLKEADQVD